MRFIDRWDPWNKVFHVTAESEIERTGSRETRRPDIVRFWSSSANTRTRKISGLAAVMHCRGWI